MRACSVTFSMLAATPRGGEVKQRQHFCHHAGTICHPRSSYVTTKLYGTSTCGCNNDAIFSDRAIFTFPTAHVFGHVKLAAAKPWRRVQSSNMAALLNSLAFAFKISFLPKYRVKYYDYNCKVVQWDTM